jgi:hypothetical protein
MKYICIITTMLFSRILAQGSQVVVPGDSNYDYDTRNQEDGLYVEDTSQIYSDLIMDLNMCAVEVIYKFGLSKAVKETVDIMNNQNWIIEIRNAEGKAYRDILGKTLEPIASSLLGISGDEMVGTLPSVVLGWFVDSAVVFAVTQGTVTEEEAQAIEKPCPKSSPKEVIVEVIVEKIVYVDKIVEVEKIVYVDC